MRVPSTLVIIALLFLLPASTSRAQEIPDHVKKAISQLVGDWTCETVIGDMTSKWELHCRMTPDETSVIYHWSGADMFTGKPTSGSGILGWDGVKQMVVELEIDSDGSTFRSTHHILESGEWRSPTTGSTVVDGKPVYLESLREFKFSEDGKTWTGRDLHRILDGKPQPDGASICRKKPATPPTDARAALLDYGERMVGGVWNDGQPKNADEHAYRWHFQDKLLLRVHKAPAALSLITISPATNKQTEWQFGADGSVEKSTWTLQARRDSAVIWESPSGKYAGRYQVEHEKDAISITPLDPNSVFPAKSVWNRRPLEGRFPSLASDTPKEIPSALSQLEHLVGFKSIDGVMPDSQKTIGASQGRWILGGKFFLYTSAFMTEDQMAWGQLMVAGVDPESGKATSWEFSSEGAMGTFTYSDDGRAVSGGVTEADGSRFDFNGTFQQDGDVFRYKSVGRTAENANQPYSWNWRDAK